MSRSQVILDDWQYDALKARAERQGTSFSALVREAVARYLSSDEEGETPTLEAMAGIGADEGATGRDHDAHLYPDPRPARRSSSNRRPTSRRG